jgi:hypothetical protein
MINKLYFTITNIRKTAYQHYGPSPFSLLKFIYYGLFRVNMFILFENDLKNEIPAYKIDNKFTLLMPSIIELDEMRKGKDLPREFYYDKIHNVKKCFVVTCDGEMAYIHWVYFKGDHNRFLKLEDFSAELNYAYTQERFKGQGLYKYTIAYSTQYLKSVGYKKVIGICHIENYPVIKTLTNIGFREKKRFIAIGPFNGKYRA